MHSVTLAIIALISVVMGTGSSLSEPTDSAFADWPYYGGDAGGSRYSTLTQINKTNVPRPTLMARALAGRRWVRTTSRT